MRKGAAPQRGRFFVYADRYSFSLFRQRRAGGFISGQQERKCISVYFLLEKGPVFLYNGYPYCDIHGKSLISLRKQYTIKKIVFSDRHLCCVLKIEEV